MLRLAVVLTMHNATERQAMYRPRLEWWCNHTPADAALYVVNSAPRPVHMPCAHARVLDFDQSEHFRTRVSSTQYELYALGRVLDRFPELATAYKAVFKVTAKYVLPGFWEAARSLPEAADLYVQGRHMGNANTEVLGMRASILPHVLWVLPHMLHGPKRGCCIENMLEKLMSATNLNVHRLPRLTVPAVPSRAKRGAGDVMSALRRARA